MTSSERWLAATWPLLRSRLPAAPARVVDVGCGSLGGFVPMLREHGYDAVGIDPCAPDEPHYRRVEFERAELRRPADAFVASTSLHHVADPATVIERLAGRLASGGTVIVFEWAWEEFDERTAEWSFARLPPPNEAGWLHRRREEWRASGLDWPGYMRHWARREGLHRGDGLVRLLDARFERRLLEYGPFLFTDLAGTSQADEQTAIDAGEIRAMRIDWVGTLP